MTRDKYQYAIGFSSGAYNSCWKPDRMISLHAVRRHSCAVRGIAARMAAASGFCRVISEKNKTTRQMVCVPKACAARCPSTSRHTAYATAGPPSSDAVAALGDYTSVSGCAERRAEARTKSATFPQGWCGVPHLRDSSFNHVPHGCLLIRRRARDKVLQNGGIRQPNCVVEELSNKPNRTMGTQYESLIEEKALDGISSITTKDSG